MPGHGGNRTYDLWNTSPMLCQLSYPEYITNIANINVGGGSDGNISHISMTYICVNNLTPDYLQLQ